MAPPGIPDYVVVHELCQSTKSRRDGFGKRERYYLRIEEEKNMMLIEIIAGYYGGFFMWKLMTGLAGLMVKKLQGLKLGYFRFLCWRVQKINGTFRVSRDRISLVPVWNMRITEQGMCHKKYRAVYHMAEIFVCLIFSALPCIFIFYLAGGTEFFRMYMLATIICCAFWLFTLLAGACGTRMDSSAGGYAKKWEEILQLLLQGVRPRELEDKLQDDVELSAKCSFNRYQYVLIQYYCALEKGDMERVKGFAHKLENALPERNAPSFFSGIFGEMVFFYSQVERDSEKAEYYLKNSPALVENDIDLNGRRVYAYYLYGTLGEAEKALKTIEEGLAVAQDFAVPGNIPMETELLVSLRETIQRQFASTSRST